MDELKAFEDPFGKKGKEHIYQYIVDGEIVNSVTADSQEELKKVMDALKQFQK